MEEPVAAGAVLRPTVRVLLMDGADRVLLFRMHPIGRPPFWAPPGGGIEPGETDEQAAARERWYLARVDSLEVDEAGWTDDERLDMSVHRWWTPDELDATDEEVTPHDLAGRVRSILTDGPPAEPWALGD
jgi:hypothetical protein